MEYERFASSLPGDVLGIVHMPNPERAFMPGGVLRLDSLGQEDLALRYRQSVNRNLDHSADLTVESL
jgi:hypothetical protein